MEMLITVVVLAVLAAIIAVCVVPVGSSIGSDGDTTDYDPQDDDTTESEEDDEDETDEEDNDREVLEITEGVNDSYLQLEEGDEALLIYFFHEYNEVCEAQTEIVEQSANRWPNVCIVKADCGYSDNLALMQLHAVHQVPTFVLRRRGAVMYHKLAKQLDAAGLDDFIKQSLAVAAE